jgi:hypothetical protein
MSDQIAKKRSSKLYFKANGRISTYKCIAKGLEYERIIDYLALNECKARTQNVVCLVAS